MSFLFKQSRKSAQVKDHVFTCCKTKRMLSLSVVTPLSCNAWRQTLDGSTNLKPGDGRQYSFTKQLLHSASILFQFTLALGLSLQFLHNQSFEIIIIVSSSSIIVVY